MLNLDSFGLILTPLSFVICDYLCLSCSWVLMLARIGIVLVLDSKVVLLGMGLISSLLFLFYLASSNNSFIITLEDKDEISDTTISLNISTFY